MLDNSLIIPYQPQKAIPSFQVGTFLSGQQKRRALVPVDKGLVFYGDEKDKYAIYNQIQYTLLVVLQIIKQEAVEITVLDFSIDNTFNWLLNLSDCIKVSKLTDVKQFNDFIDRLRQQAIHINHAFLGRSQFDSLAQYNQSVESPEPYRIVILTDSWRNITYFKNAELIELIEKGYKAGIYFICVLDGVVIEAEKKALKERYKHTENVKKDVFAICDAMAKHLIGIFPTPNGKAIFSNINIPAFYRYAQAYSFQYNAYPFSEVQQVSDMLKKNVSKNALFVKNFLEVPIGRVGNSPVLWEFGDKNGCFNAFIAGAVGSGKSSFLQNFILTIAEKYSPDEFHFLIMDYKNGNDFNLFKTLPHLEFLLLDNSRFDKAMAILKQFLEEKKRRGDLFTDLSNTLGTDVPNLATFNRLSDKKLPYKLLIIDEIHELFFGSNKQMDYQTKKSLQDTFQLIIRQGRAYGLHIIICTQNLEGFDLGDGIMEQIKLRVSFQLSSETECRHILATDNTLPLDLERFEAVLNTQNGRSDATTLGKKYNTIFKSIYVGDITARIKTIAELWAKKAYSPFEKTIVEKGAKLPVEPEEIRTKPIEDMDEDFMNSSWS